MSSSILPSYTRAGHSAEIEMQLLVNGSALPIAQLGPDFLILRETAEHPPTDATIVMRVDASERRWQVRLPGGLAAGCERVVISKV
jgi:hypothetical protein